MKYFRIVTNCVFLGMAVILFGCNNTTTKEYQHEDVADTATAKEEPFTASVFTLPAPMQIANQIIGYSPSYNEAYLIPISKDATLATYTVDDMAMILGMYSVDLGYSVVYDRQQSILNYTSKVKTMSDELGIMGAFKPEVIKRIEKNIGNIDSLTQIILGSFNDVNTYFNDNDRQKTGSMVLTGGLIEGMNLSTQVALELKSDISFKAVAKQKFFLDNAIRIIDPDESDSLTTNLLFHLKGLKAEFDKIEITYKEESGEINKKVVDQITITEEQVAIINQKVIALRKIILE